MNIAKKPNPAKSALDKDKNSYVMFCVKYLPGLVVAGVVELIVVGSVVVDISLVVALTELESFVVLETIVTKHMIKIL